MYLLRVLIGSQDCLCPLCLISQYRLITFWVLVEDTQKKTTATLLIKSTPQLLEVSLVHLTFIIFANKKLSEDNHE